MSEVAEGKELKGIGGWLVLFQIQIWSTLAGAAQMLVLFPIMGLLTRNLVSSSVFDFPGFNVSELFKIYTSPFTYAYAGIILVLVLMCVIFFYKKKLIFRIFYIIEAAVNLAATCFLIFYFVRILGSFYSDIFGGQSPFDGVFTIFYGLFTLLPGLGIAIAFIIALFKSKRVKNTFS